MINDPRRLTPHRRQHWGVEPDPERELEPDEPEVDDVPVEVRKRILWRDSAIILIGLILALLAAQVFLPGGVGLPGASPTFPPGVAVGSFGPPPGSLPPGVTFGPILDPSLGIDATPTPIPVITMGPTASPSPSVAPSPSPSPRRTLRPPRTLAPSLPPTQAPPPPTVPPDPTPTPVPPPTVSISCNVIAPLTVECTASVTNIQSGSQDWSTDGGEVLTGGDGSDNVTYLYTDTDPRLHNVTLIVTGVDGSTASDSEEVTV